MLLLHVEMISGSVFSVAHGARTPQALTFYSLSFLFNSLIVGQQACCVFVKVCGQ